MTRDDIIRMAQEAGMSMDFHDQFSINHGYRNPDVDTLKKFAELCMAAEREACAKVCENGTFLHEFSPEAKYSRACSRSIRERGRK